MVVLATVVAPALAKGPDADADARTDVFWHEAPTLLPVRLLYPPDFDPAAPHTLVVALHGFGGSAEGFRRVGERLADAGVIVALPESAYAFMVEGRDLGFDWTLYHTGDSALGARAMGLLGLDYLPGVVKAVRERHPIDRVYALGFSQGAVVALLTGVHNVDLFDGVVSFGLPGLEARWLDADGTGPADGLDVLLVHGRRDDRAPFEVSKECKAALEERGYDVTFRPFPGGHVVPDDQLDFAATWMQRIPEPAE